MPKVNVAIFSVTALAMEWLSDAPTCRGASAAATGAVDGAVCAPAQDGASDTAPSIAAAAVQRRIPLTVAPPGSYLCFLAHPFPTSTPHRAARSASNLPMETRMTGAFTFHSFRKVRA